METTRETTDREMDTMQYVHSMERIQLKKKGKEIMTHATT